MRSPEYASSIAADFRLETPHSALRTSNSALRAADKSFHTEDAKKGVGAFIVPLPKLNDAV